MKLSRAILLGAGAWLAVRAIKTLRAFDFRNKTVVVTGGARGLGLVMARQLVRSGARVAICARGAAEVERGRQQLADLGGPVLARPCDLRNALQAEELIHAVESELGPVDVLVNNAGVLSAGPISTMNLADFSDAMANNFWSALHATMAVLPGMRDRRTGRILNITSFGGKIPVPHVLPYCASKFAFVGLSEGLRAELRQDGIMVTTVCPGLMRTGSVDQVTFKGNCEIEHAGFALGASLPIISMSAERAAAQALAACARGDAEIVLGMPYKLAALIHGVMPGTTADVLGMVNRLLPHAEGTTSAKKGYDCPSAVAPSLLTTLNDRAAARNNESPVRAQN